MRKALTITLVAALALFAGSAAYANYCARDVVPASTILVPYAVQDMDGQYTASEKGQATILTITNVSADAQFIHITVWNALSIPVLDFNEVLTGYDVWQINFRDMIRGNFSFFDTTLDKPAAWMPSPGANYGNRTPFEWGPDGRSTTVANPPLRLPVPQKTSTLAPTTECYMPYGDFPAGELNDNINNLRSPLVTRTHNGCATQKVRPEYANDWLSKITADWGYDLWFYVTVDVATQCNFQFPTSLDYFDINYLNENVLIGDIVYLNKLENFSEAISAVHLESDPPNASAGVNFYEEKDNNGNAIGGGSELEPLATAFAFNYYNFDDPQYFIHTDVMVWKNFQDFVPANDKVDDCGYYMYYSWDFDEHTESRAGSCTVSPCDPNDIDPNEFPFETQRVAVTDANFDLVGVPGQEQGWLLFIFPPSYINIPGWVDPTPANTTHNAADQNFWMAWMGVRYTYDGFSAALEAATIANRHCFPAQQLQQLGVNFDGDGNGAPAN